MANQFPIPLTGIIAAALPAPATRVGCPILARAFCRKSGRIPIQSNRAFISGDQMRNYHPERDKKTVILNIMTCVASYICNERPPHSPQMLRAPFLRFLFIARAGNLNSQSIPFIRSDRSTAKGVEGPAFDLRKPSSSLLVALLCVCAFTPAQIAAQATEPTSPVVLDRVVAVVNNQAILSSDIDNEIRLSVLDPGRGGLGVLTRPRALDQLIGRALIQQQIRQEDLESADPTQAEVEARLTEIRTEVPACVHRDCASQAGWNAFLSSQGLTQEHVETYLRYRIEILRFIEQRFRQGISIEPKEIETYYHDTLIPQYAKGEAIPPLDQVSARIQEILLQQRVNVMFDDWLNNLRKQGDIEVLDPALESPSPEAPATSSGPQAAPATNKKGSQ